MDFVIRSQDEDSCMSAEALIQAACDSNMEDLLSEEEEDNLSADQEELTDEQRVLLMQTQRAQAEISDAQLASCLQAVWGYQSVTETLLFSGRQAQAKASAFSFLHLSPSASCSSSHL